MKERQSKEKAGKDCTGKENGKKCEGGGGERLNKTKKKKKCSEEKEGMKDGWKRRGSNNNLSL